MADNVDIRVRLRDARRAQQDARNTSTAIRGIGTAARSAKTGVGDMGAAGVRGLQTAAVGAAAAVAGIGAVGLKMGLGFNAQMQSAQLRFELFSDSAEEAKEVLAGVGRIDATSAFDLPGLADAAAFLGNAGIEATKVEKTLQGVANAAAAAGGGGERLQRISTALGQIQSRGTITAEEVNQLADAGVNVRKILKREFKLSGDEMANLGEQGIDSRKAINAIVEDWTSGKMSRAASAQISTLGGQWDLLTGNVQKATGALTLGLAGALQKDVLPAANKASEAVTKIFQSDLPVEEKMRRARAVIVRELGPVAHEIGDQIENAHLDQKLGQAMEKALPVMMNAGADLAGEAAKAFVKAWLSSGTWVQLLSLAWLAKRLGAFGALGGLAATRFRAAWGRGMAAPLPGGTVAPPVGAPGAKGPTPAPGPAGAPKGGGGKLAGGLGVGGAIGLLGIGQGGQLPLTPKQKAEFGDGDRRERWPSTGIDPRRAEEGRPQRVINYDRRTMPPTPAPERQVVLPDRPPERPKVLERPVVLPDRRPSPAPPAVPERRQRDIVVKSELQVDRKTIAVAEKRHTADRKARE